MVGQRTLNPFIGVRIPAWQHVNILKATPWYCYTVHQNMPRNRWLIGIIFAFLFFGLGFTADRIFNTPTASRIIRLTEGKKGLITPLLGFEIANVTEFDLLKPLTKALKKEVAKRTGRDSGVTGISVYYRGLNSGWWTGVNIDEQYYPASLLKVPLMLYYLKAAQNNSALLGQKIVYTKELNAKVGNNDQNLQGVSTLEIGGTYTIKQMITNMITASDNRSTSVLFNRVNAHDLAGIFTDIGLPDTIEHDTYTISPKEYALFFRFLYNATYLNQPMSEMALELLSQADFKTGLTALLPTSTLVAHKFGNYTDDAKKEEQLHDCGIVYYEPNPYFICVMTRGKDGEQEMQAIQAVSKIVYDDISSRRK
jgi:beta-lactamase class A